MTREIVKKCWYDKEPDKWEIKALEKRLEKEGWRKAMNHIYVKDGEMINTVMTNRIRK